MDRERIVEIIKNYKIITNIFEEDYMCDECNKAINLSNIEFGDIQGTFKCSCGEHYVMANDKEIPLFTSYSYDFDGAFIMRKETFYETVDLEKRMYIQGKSRVALEVLSLCIKTVNGNRHLSYKYINSKNPTMEYINECGDFFNEFAIEDFREMGNAFSMICMDNRIKPNYGELLKPFIKDYNMHNYMDLFRLIFTNPLMEFIVKGDFTYLIEKNPIKGIGRFNDIVRENNGGSSLKDYLEIPNKALKFISENRLGIYVIEEVWRFFRERNYQEFSIIIEEYKFPFSVLGRAASLLNDGYKIRKLCDYVIRISE
ncbi:MAG: hypothetical protein ACRC2K_00530, partial [Clostridium sp.]